MIKKAVGVVLLALFSTTFFGQNAITIKGNIQFVDSYLKKVSLIKREGQDKKTIAESAVVNNQYVLDIPAVEPGVYTLDCMWQSINVWVEDENLEVNFRGADTAKIKIKNPPYVFIKGGAKNEVMNQLNYASYRSYQWMIEVSQATYAAHFETDDEKQKLAMRLYDFDNKDYSERVKYIVEHNDDKSSVMAAIYCLDYSQEKALINRVLENVKKDKTGKKLADEYLKEQKKKEEQIAKMAIGSKAPDFKCFDQSGKKTYSLKDFKGKVTIIDFWASWCGPCRQEIPNLKKYYEEYKDQGVEFLSISVDKKDADWEKALKEENMPWHQAHTKDAGKQLMFDYQFNGIPFIIVLDKEGKIYAKNVRGEKIKTTLDKLLKGDKPQVTKSIAMPAMGM